MKSNGLFAGSSGSSSASSSGPNDPEVRGRFRYQSHFAKKTGLLFASALSLDFLDLRVAVIRIPEVSLRLREAQRLIDDQPVAPFDLVSWLLSDDEVFESNIAVKKLLGAIVQVALYDRYGRSHRDPDVVVGWIESDSATDFCVGKKSFADLVLQSSAVAGLGPKQVREIECGVGTAGGSSAEVSAMFGSQGLKMESLPIGGGNLSQGLPTGSAPLSFDGDRDIRNPIEIEKPDHVEAASPSLLECRVMQRDDEGRWVESLQSTRPIVEVLVDVVNQFDVFRFVTIGPGVALSNAEASLLSERSQGEEVTAMDSIDLDPMLSWFWREVRQASGFQQ